jgi:protein phosphatase
MATTEITTELRKMLDQDVALEVDPDTGLSGAQRLLRDIACKVNTSIYETARRQPQDAGMGTTLVAALFHDNKVSVVHIGDSRLYRMRGTDFQQLTRDHSLVQEQIDAGLLTPEQAKLSTRKNLVMRALGVSAAVEPEIHEYDALPGDVYLLCSDGLSGMVSDWHIGMALRTFGANLKSCAHQLIQMANDNGGRDNVSVILIRVLSEYAAPRPRAAPFP